VWHVLDCTLAQVSQVLSPSFIRHARVVTQAHIIVTVHMKPLPFPGVDLEPLHVLLFLSLSINFSLIWECEGYLRALCSQCTLCILFGQGLFLSTILLIHPNRQYVNPSLILRHGIKRVVLVHQRLKLTFVHNPASAVTRSSKMVVSGSDFRLCRL